MAYLLIKKTHFGGFPCFIKPTTLLTFLMKIKNKAGGVFFPCFLMPRSHEDFDGSAI